MAIDYMALHIFTLVMQGITCVLGILGNGLVIWVAGFRMALTVTTFYYLNLALADFLFAATLPFFMVVNARKGQWPFGWLLCKLINFFADTNLFASVFLIAFIALDRCICVLHPVWAQNHRTVSLAIKVIIVPWILATVLNLPALIFFTTQEEDNNVLCAFDLEFWGNVTEEEKMHRLFTSLKIIGINRFVIGFTFPMSIIAICYGLTAAKICKKGMTNSGRPLLVLTAVVASFFICWFPFQLCLLLGAVWIREIVSEGNYIIFVLLSIFACLLTFFNSSINPTLYAFMSKDFRKRLIHSLPASLVRTLTKDSAPTSDTTTKSASPATEAQLQEI